jgi:hypothetical protein
MAYNKYTTEAVINTFSLSVQTWQEPLKGIEPVEPSAFLQKALDNYLDLAVMIGTEKSRSEFIVAPILGEVYNNAKDRISLFSGTTFNVDVKQKLNGVCDFLISKSPVALVIQSPVVAVVEAKRDNLEDAIGQCAAEMIAAQIFNQKNGQPIDTIYGATTSGENWKFLKLIDKTLYVQPRSVSLEKLPHILGWFMKAVE